VEKEILLVFTAEDEASHGKRRCEMTTPGFVSGVRMMHPDSRMKEIEHRNNNSPTVALIVVMRARARTRSPKTSLHTSVHDTRRCAE
jgi:hypothetical protein